LVVINKLKLPWVQVGADVCYLLIKPQYGAALLLKL
jgi:hypothetical protein